MSLIRKWRHMIWKRYSWTTSQEHLDNNMGRTIKLQVKQWIHCICIPISQDVGSSSWSTCSSERSFHLAIFTATELLNKRHALKFVAWIDFMNVGAHIPMSAREHKEQMNSIYASMEKVLWPVNKHHSSAWLYPDRKRQVVEHLLAPASDSLCDLSDAQKWNWWRECVRTFI